jgi:nuclear transport factor 2 (NTF2) superfamily protein
MVFSDIPSSGIFGKYSDENGLMARRIASINDLPISESVRKFFWLLGRYPDDHAGFPS